MPIPTFEWKLPGEPAYKELKAYSPEEAAIQATQLHDMAERNLIAQPEAKVVILIRDQRTGEETTWLGSGYNVPAYSVEETK